MNLTELKQKIRTVFTPEQAEVLEEYANVLNDLVKVSDFNELKQIVKELAEAQKELTEVQKRSEKRLDRLEHIVEELVEAQKQTAQEVKELAEAQKQTAQEVKELAEAQKQTAQEVKELAEAQKQTEQEVKALAKELRNLVQEHKKTRQELGGLSHSFGYILEDRAYKGLPAILKEKYNIQIIEPLKRKFFPYKGNRNIEINIIGKGLQDNKEIWIIGEAKTQLKKKHIEEFLKKQYIFNELFKGEKFYLFVTNITNPETEEYAKEKGIEIFYSYEFPL